MATLKFSQLSELLESIKNEDVFAIEVDGKTMQVRASLLCESIASLFTSGEGAGLHNSIYRGKNLGTAVTPEQYTRINAGTFHDMWIGDYWVVNSRVYRIAAFDYWLHHGDTGCETHHVVIVPDACLYSAQMNSTNTTEGGYVGSAMHTANLAQAKTTINGDFGEAHILSHREYFVNAVKNGKASSDAWCDSKIDLMNEEMVYGTSFFTPHSDGTTINSDSTIDKSQLPLFRLDHSRICNRAGWWLRSVVSPAYFALVGSRGACDYSLGSNSLGVRPAFGIVA